MTKTPTAITLLLFTACYQPGFQAAYNDATSKTSTGDATSPTPDESLPPSSDDATPDNTVETSTLVGDTTGGDDGSTSDDEQDSDTSDTGDDTESGLSACLQELQDSLIEDIDNCQSETDRTCLILACEHYTRSQNAYESADCFEMHAPDDLEALEALEAECLEERSIADCLTGADTAPNIEGRQCTAAEAAACTE